MLTETKLAPRSHLGMPGDIQKHTLAPILGRAMLFTIFQFEAHRRAR